MPTPSSMPRPALLEHPDALECTIYRANEADPDAEEQDMGDARILMAGPFEPPAEWSAQERADYFDGTPAEAFITARFECLAEPGSKDWFTVEADDYAAVMEAPGQIAMFYVCERLDDGSGLYVLIREEEEDEGDY